MRHFGIGLGDNLHSELSALGTSAVVHNETEVNRENKNYTGKNYRGWRKEREREGGGDEKRNMQIAKPRGKNVLILSKV